MRGLFKSKLFMTLAAAVMIVATLAFLLSGSLAASKAASPGHKTLHGHTAPRGAYATASGHKAVHLKASHVKLQPRTGGHGGDFLYVDDGTCPDSIDVYSLPSLFFVGNFPNTACNAGAAFFGAQAIAVTGGNGTHSDCLVLTDDSGFVDSFPLNPPGINGGVGFQASQVFDGGFFDSRDVHISSNGSLVYVNNPFVALETYRLGAGCALSPAIHPSINTSGHEYLSFALANPNRLVTTDTFFGTIDTYVLAPFGGISFLASDLGQIGSPDSVAVQSTPFPFTKVFTGQATFGAPQAQGDHYTVSTGAISPLVGSPASDPFASNGAAVTVSNTFSLLIQAEQFSGSLGVYGVTSRTLTFMEHTPLAFFFAETSDLAQFGSTTLFVDGGFSGDVEACTIAANVVFGCTTVVVLTNPFGFSDGIAVL